MNTKIHFLILQNSFFATKLFTPETSYTHIVFSLLLGLPLASISQESEGRITDPLTLSGEVGTQIVSSWNNVDKFYNTPFSATAYANMTLNLYGISIPMSLNFVNTNDKPFAFSKPNFMISFRAHP